MCIIYFGILDNTFSFCIGYSDWHHEVFIAHKKTCLWSPGIHCPPMINFFCGTSTLMLVRGQFVTCVCSARSSAFFSRRSSSTSSSAPQSVDSGCRCLRLL